MKKTVTELHDLIDELFAELFFLEKQFQLFEEDKFKNVLNRLEVVELKVDKYMRNHIE